MSFKEFCTALACVNEHTVAGDEIIVPAKYEQKLNVFMESIKSKVNRFDKLDMTYIQTAMRDPALTSRITAEVPDEEIPSGIINKLATTLYGNKYDELENDNKMIINVLSIYFIISN